jgi:uncharacterized damage-inducible protein DinB
MKNSIVSDAFAHHVWASRTLIEACLPLTDEQLATTVPGTYGSILETLRHVVGADRSYLSLLTDGAVSEIDEDSMSLAEIRDAMVAVDDGWTAFLAGDVDPDLSVVRHRDDGMDSGAPMSIRLAQAVQHGTDHRSQVSTALTTLGVEPPELDVWAYAWSRGLLTETPRAGS